MEFVVDQHYLKQMTLVLTNLKKCTHLMLWMSGDRNNVWITLWRCNIQKNKPSLEHTRIYIYIIMLIITILHMPVKLPFFDYGEKKLFVIATALFFYSLCQRSVVFAEEPLLYLYHVYLQYNKEMFIMVIILPCKSKMLYLLTLLVSRYYLMLCRAEY